MTEQKLNNLLNNLKDQYNILEYDSKKIISELQKSLDEHRHENEYLKTQNFNNNKIMQTMEKEISIQK